MTNVSEFPPPPCKRRDVALRAADGYALAGTFYEPAQPTRARVVVNSATGVRRSYYRRFAEYLAGHGFEVLTYDYRGIGGSAPERLRGFPARMRDWGQLDFPGVLDWCEKDAPGRTLFAIGHSVGGQILGLAPNNELVAGLIGVSAQKTWWKLWPASSHWRLRMLWSVLIPSLSHTMGYFPSPWFGLGENLPKGVALEWATWANARGYTPEVIGEFIRANFSRYGGSILAFSFEDDTFAPEATVAGLLELFDSAERTHRHVTPGDLGRPIGHFGFFRDVFRDTLWAEARYWLEHRSPAPAS